VYQNLFPEVRSDDNVFQPSTFQFLTGYDFRRGDFPETRFRCSPPFPKLLEPASQKANIPLEVLAESVLVFREILQTEDICGHFLHSECVDGEEALAIHSLCLATLASDASD
jgi:hypothetical protein